jgi:hypothetical protein
VTTSKTFELTWAALDAHSIAKLLDQLTPSDGGLSVGDLCLTRAYAWALAEGLKSIVAKLPRAAGADRDAAALP